MKKRISIILLVMAMLFGIPGCGEKEDNLVGIWIITGGDQEESLELYSDGTAISNAYNSDGDLESYDCMWIAENGRLKITFDMGILGTSSSSCDYEIKKDTLKLYYENDPTIYEYHRKK